MPNNYKKITLCAAAVAALFTGTPPVADDTELLLVNPDPSTQPTPNVMFILDTSGSMQTLEETTQPYDSTQNYSGSCDPDRLYWTEVSVTPVCDGNETRFIEKSSFHCDFATKQLDGIGSFTNTMVQYRSDAAGLAANWQHLAPGNNTDPVECQADSGKHGDGTVGQVYASAISGLLTNPWTSSEKLEISWGSSPRNVAYTVYDGNYLNWKSSPVKVNLTRNTIMRTVVKTVLNSLNNLNVGVIRFNDEEGGTVIQSIVDLDNNRSQILGVIDALNADGFTPLAESLYESALYWNGLPAEYAKVNDHVTDPAALRSTTPPVYRNPAIDVCAKNYNVLLTDGEPVEDIGAQTLAPTLPDFATLLNRTACTGSDEGDCLDDIAEYLALVDTAPNTPGLQNVTTHTIGFNVDLPILRETATASGGEYFLANDVESLTLALLEIVADINDRALSFAAPAVSVNTFNRTQNLNRLYLTVFGARPNVHWPGNLKRYEIANGTIVDANGNAAVNPATGFFFDTAMSFWTQGGADGNDVRRGGAAMQLPAPTARNLYTNNGDPDLTAGSNQIKDSNSGAFTDADFGLSGSPQEPTRKELINWARGEDIRDEDNDPSTTQRNAMGDPLHSQPAAIVYGGNSANPEVVVYTATNDGYLHAIDGNTGQELWSFIPRELLPNMTRLFFDPSSKFKNYGIDGDVVPVVRDINENGIVDGNDFVYIIFGMRRGGSNYYALDVTNEQKPQLLWKASFPNSGQSWSTPVVTRININTGGLNQDKAVLVLGDGYDPVHDSAAHPSTPDGSGAGIRILDLVTGNVLWRAGRDGGADLQLPGMTRAIPTQIRVLDVSGDGFADRFYAADLGGQIWRIDIRNGNTPATLATGGVIARLGAEGQASPAAADTRRFYNTPDVSIFTDPAQNRRYMAISIGSGYRAHPFDLSATDRFFSLRDPDVFRQLSAAEYLNYNVITDNSLVDVSGRLKVELGSGDRGWKFTLPSDQKVLTDSVTFDNDVFFVAFSPKSNAQATCSAGQGTNFLYRVSVINGDPVVNNLDSLSPSDADEARRDTLAQGGIAPSPAILFPSPDTNCTGAACSPPPIGCVGVECFDPGFVNNPVRTLWSQDGVQ